MQLTVWHRKAIASIDDGHLTLWIRADGTVDPDRQVIGLNADWWAPLVEHGLLERFELGDGRAIYRPTDAARMALHGR